MARWNGKMLLVAAALAPLGLIGCIPMQPWVTERMEEKYLHKNDWRTPIMPPIRDGFPAPLCVDEPTEQEVLRAMPRVARGVPFVYEEFRDDIEFVFEKIADKIDPPRFFPLVGPAQLHHCHWKCTVYYTETIQSSQPSPVKLKRRRVEVVYIDKDHLHQYVGCDPDVQRQITHEHTGY